MVAEYRGASTQLLCYLASPLYSRVAFPGWCAHWSGLPPFSRIVVVVAMTAESRRVVSKRASQYRRNGSRPCYEVVDGVKRSCLFRIRRSLFRKEAKRRA